MNKKEREQAFIEFVYNAPFSNETLIPMSDAINEMIKKGKTLSTKTEEFNQIVKFEDIKGTCEFYTKNSKYAGKLWRDLIVIEGYLNDEIETLYYQLNKWIEHQHTLGEVALLDIDGKYFIKDGHKCTALARYLHKFHNIPGYLTGTHVTICKFTDSQKNLK